MKFKINDLFGSFEIDTGKQPLYMTTCYQPEPEPSAILKTNRGKIYDLMFVCRACHRRTIFTNRVHENKMRCSVCSHDEFEIEMLEEEK